MTGLTDPQPRRRAASDSVLRDPAAWARLWYDALTNLAHMSETPPSDRWRADDPMRA